MTAAGRPFDGHVAGVIDGLDEVEAVAGEGTTRELRRAGRPFAVVDAGRLEVRLDAAVAAAARRTPDVHPSPRGSDWILFAPGSDAGTPMDLDRAEAWLRFAHRHAGSG